MALERLSNLSDWDLVHSDQDIRGHDLYDANGNDTGLRVDDLIVDTDRERVTAIVLEDGTEYDAGEIEVDDNYAYLKTGTHDMDTADTEEMREEKRAVAEDTGDDRTVRVYDDVHAHQGRSTLAFSEHGDTYREHYSSTFGDSDRDYEHYEPAYRYGHEYGAADRYEGRDYEDVEPEIRRDYEQRHGEGTYADVRDATRHAFRHSRDRRTAASSS